MRVTWMTLAILCLTTIASIYWLSYQQSDESWDVGARLNKTKTATDNIGDISLSTDPRYTLIVFKDDKYFSGQEFQAKIFARNYRNQQKTYGGDFFQAILRRRKVGGDGVAATITDHLNGTYSIFAPLLWEGEMELTVSLIHSSEAIEAVKLKTSGKSVGFGFRAVTGKDNETEIVKCGPYLGNQKNVCNFSNPAYGEPYYCMKPHTGGCEAITQCQFDEEAEESIKWKIEWGEYFILGVTWEVKIKGSGRIFKVENLKYRQRNQLSTDVCSFETLKNTIGAFNVTGLFHDGKWVSTICKNRIFSLKEARKCLANTDVHMLGDSTTRQWYLFLQKWFNLKVVKIYDHNGYLISGKSRSSGDNITTHFTMHGPPFLSIVPLSLPSNRFMSSELDKIQPDTTNTVVFLSFGLHFLTFPTSFFRLRVKKIKYAMKKLTTRIPNAKIFIKTINFHHNDAPIRRHSQWACDRLNKILIEELNLLQNVLIINTWDMTLIQTPYGIHPGDEILSPQLHLFLSYLCPGV